VGRFGISVFVRIFEGSKSNRGVLIERQSFWEALGPLSDRRIPVASSLDNRAGSWAAAFSRIMQLIHAGSWCWVCGIPGATLSQPAFPIRLRITRAFGMRLSSRI